MLTGNIINLLRCVIFRGVMAPMLWFWFLQERYVKALCICMPLCKLYESLMLLYLFLYVPTLYNG